MNLEIIMMMTFFLNCLFLGILILIISKIDFNVNIDEQLRKYKYELEKAEQAVTLGNKKINKIEKEILICKKKLGFKLFNK